MFAVNESCSFAIAFETDLWWKKRRNRETNVFTIYSRVIHFERAIMNEDQPMPTFLTSRKSKKNRQTKTQLVFDEAARK